MCSGSDHRGIDYQITAIEAVGHNLAFIDLDALFPFFQCSGSRIDQLCMGAVGRLVDVLVNRAAEIGPQRVTPRYRGQDYINALGDVLNSIDLLQWGVDTHLPVAYVNGLGHFALAVMVMLPVTAPTGEVNAGTTVAVLIPCTI